ncbi:unnamed protein product [Caenorhabditis nigoni]
MPDDIKLECIGKMKFRERLSLRCTAKAERSLVDSQKMRIFKCDIYESDSDFKNDGDDDHIVQISSKDSFLFIQEFKNAHEAFDFMIYLFKIGVFEHVTIDLNDMTVKEELKKFTGEVSTKNIDLDCRDNEMVVAVLQKVKNGVESIKIDCKEDIDYKFDEILAISQVQNSKYWHIANYRKSDALHKVAQVWIDKNAEIGSTFQLSAEIDGSADEFLEHFTDRIVSKSEERIRIRTNSVDRHILLERGLDDYIGINDFPEFFRLLVISAEMKESEYDDDCEEWIWKIDPRAYDESSDSSFVEHGDEYYYPDERD